MSPALAASPDTAETAGAARAAVVTGLGIVAPNGLGLTDYWDALLRGESALRRVTRFDVSGYRSTIAGEVPNFDPARYLPDRLMPQTDITTKMALVASDWALHQAGLDDGDLPTNEVGVVTAAAGGGYEFGQRELAKLHSLGPAHVSAYQSFAWFYAVNSGQISIRHKLRGHGSVLISDQAGGLDAIGHARRQLRGGAMVNLVGGVDSALSPWAWVSHQSTGWLSTSAAPDCAYLPFDARAAGHVPGEGGAILVLEHADSARRRNAAILGEIAGYAATFDSVQPAGSAGLRRAIEAALKDAALEPGDIGVVFADAAAAPAADRAEADALRAVFGPAGVPVTAPKTMTGRLFAGGAALDVATALLVLDRAVIPPTVNVSQLVPDYGLDLVTEPRRQPVQAALVLARGRGGFNSAVVVRKHQ
jgi:minimal PKS chain-length factor (CLF/KS beta)